MPLQPPPDFRDAESTSAALARVEAELKASVTQLMKAWGARDEWELKHNLVRAELASAQQELDALRTVRDRVLADMAEQNAIILSQLCLRCGIELDAQLAAENTNPGTTPQGETS